MTLKTVLSQPNSVVILVFLLESGGQSKATFIRDVVGNYNSVKTAGQRLAEEGLVTITNYSGKSSYILYELTPRGRNVARHLQKAETEMSGETIIDSDPDTEPKNTSDLPAERWKFIKRPCADTLLFTILQYSSITMADLKKRCKGEEAHLEDRIREAESLDLILGLHPDGPKSEIRYSLTIDGRNMAENLRRSMECQEVVSMDYDAPSEQENKVG
ncbi:MAG: hypothetical protein RBR26_05460 [Methanosarcina mazei]|nr:hypothetical protein [Methanosarcina mazei]